MEFGSYTTLPQCHAFNDFDRHLDHIDTLDCNTDGLFHDHDKLPHLSAMDRYLREIEPRFLEPSFPLSDDHFLHPFPGRVFDRRLPSPISSGSHGSSYFSSGWSDRQESPHSPLMNGVSIPQSHTFDDGVPYAYGGNPPSEHHVSQSLAVCSMHEVQKFTDHEPEVEVSFAVGQMQYGSYGAFAQEGYQPIHDVDDCASDASCYATPDEYQHPQTTQDRESYSPVIRRRRTQSRSITSPVIASRVSKRPHTARRPSSTQGSNDDSAATAANRSFPCPLATYGCQSSFTSKNEWKRHVNTQHMRLEFWRCDQCINTNGDRKPNDFNRKDLFIQHVRRMHPVDAPRSGNNNKTNSKPSKGNTEELALADAAARCCKALRSPPEQSGCLFCEQQFHAWDDRMEHIGRHMENAKKENKEPEDPRGWRVDELVQEWMINEKIIIPHGKRWTLATP